MLEIASHHISDLTLIKNSNYTGSCPNCCNTGFVISVKHKAFYCFGCEKGGGLQELTSFFSQE